MKKTLLTILSLFVSSQVFAADAAAKFVVAIEDQTLQAADFKQIINVRAMQNMTRRQKDTVNYNYWKDRDWLNADFYTNAPVSFFAYWMARYIGLRIRKAMKKGNVKPVR